MRSWKRWSLKHIAVYRKNNRWMKNMFISHYRLINIVKSIMLTIQAIPFAAPNSCILQKIKGKEISF